MRIAVYHKNYFIYYLYYFYMEFLFYFYYGFIIDTLIVTVVIQLKILFNYLAKLFYFKLRVKICLFFLNGS